MSEVVTSLPIATLIIMAIAAGIAFLKLWNKPGFN